MICVASIIINNLQDLRESHHSEAISTSHQSEWILLYFTPIKLSYKPTKTYEAFSTHPAYHATETVPFADSFWSNSFSIKLNSCQLFSTLHRCRRCWRFPCGFLGVSIGFLPIVDPHTQEASENSHWLFQRNAVSKDGHRNGDWKTTLYIA